MEKWVILWYVLSQSESCSVVPRPYRFSEIFKSAVAWPHPQVPPILSIIMRVTLKELAIGPGDEARKSWD